MLLLALVASPAQASTLNIALATDLYTPNFRGEANTTWVGWDTFDAVGLPVEIISDNTPDIGAHDGFFVTINGEDHRSGSGNYYSSAGAVAEVIGFETPNQTGGGFTTIIVQAKTVFGPLGVSPVLSDIAGVSPTMVAGDNALGEGQFYASYVIPGGLASAASITMTSAPFSFQSMDQFVIDTYWSLAAPTPITVIASPESATVCLTLVGLGSLATWTRRQRTR